MKTGKASAVLLSALVLGLGLVQTIATCAHADPVPAAWTHTDVGWPELPGSASYAPLDEAFAVTGDGADIWDAWDQFHYMYQHRGGDFMVTARVVSMDWTDAWAKAGVMIRSTLEGDSKHAMMMMTPENGATFQWRSETGGLMDARTAGGLSTPHWVRIVRRANTYRGYHSPDGVNWTLLHVQTIMDIEAEALVGLAVTSHDPGTLCTAEFDHVSIADVVEEPCELAGRWPLNEGEGDIAHDVSGHGNHGALVGVADWVEGPPGFERALHFGGDGYVEIANDEVFNLTEAITVAAWIRLDVWDRDWQTIVSRGDWSWRLQRNSFEGHNNESCSFHMTGMHEGWGANGTVSVNDGEWHHVAGTWDGARAKIYFEGVLDDDQPRTGAIGTAGDDPVTIGAQIHNGELRRQFIGSIDDVRIYNCALSAEGIWGLSQVPSEEGGLVAYYNFDEGSGAIAHDSAGSELHCTLVGNVFWVESPVGMGGYGDGLGTAVSLDGDGDLLVGEGTTGGLDFAPGSFSVSAWINPRQVEGGWRAILEYNRYQFGGSNWFGIWVNRQGGFHFRVGAFTIDTEQKLTPGYWYFVTATYDSGDRRMSVYIDARLDNVSAIEEANRYFSSPTVSKLTIGAYGPEDDEYFDGEIDEVRIYDRVLSGAEVARLWASAIPDELPDLVVERVSITPENPSLADELVIEAVIRNGGSVPSEGAEVVFASGEEWKRWMDVGPIEPGQTHTLRVTESAERLSKYPVIVTVDPKELLEESDKDNNTEMTDSKNAVMYVKDLGKYADREVFLISDENWRDVLKLVSVATWSNPPHQAQVDCYPTLIYHREGNHFDADAIIHFLQQYNQQSHPVHLSIFGSTPKELDNLLTSSPQNGAGLNASQISKYKVEDYLAFWTSIDRVIISEDKYETGLMASVLASYVNAPLLFDNNQLNTNLLNNRYCYAVGQISSNTKQEIASRCKSTTEKIYYTLDELRQTYVSATKTDKVILVNHDDLNIAVNRARKPERNPSSTVSKIYSKHSLAAPFLAAAKHEVIISTSANTYLGVDSYVEETLYSLMPPPGPLTYLTIVANPIAIPIARVNRSSCPALWGNRVALEEFDDSRLYPNYDPTKFDASKTDFQSPLNLSVVTFNSPSGVGKQTIATLGGSAADPALHKDTLVWNDYRDGQWDIFAYDLQSMKETRITNDSALQRFPAVSGPYIAWQQQHSYVEGQKTHYQWDIYCYNINNKMTTRITSHKADQVYPAIDGDKIVWHDKRNNNWDIYMYDLTLGLESQITTDGHDQSHAAISGNAIVWQDGRNYFVDPIDNKTRPQSEIYMRRLVPAPPGPLYTLGPEIRITNNNHEQWYPRMSGNTIVWEDNRNGDIDVYMYDIGTNTETRLTVSGSRQIRPVVQGNNVVWYSDGRSSVPGHAIAPCAMPCTNRWITHFYDLSTKQLLFYHNLLSHEYSNFRQEVDGRYYGSSVNFGKQDRAVGRILGMTVSDVSAYIARDVVFADLVAGLGNPKDALVLVREDHQPETAQHEIDGPTLENYARSTYWTSTVEQQFGNTHFYAGVNTGPHPVDTHQVAIRSLYDSCYLVLYADHGNSQGFAAGLDSNWLRNSKIWLQPATILDLACATCTAYYGYLPADYVFCIENLRRGAMIYMGAVDLSYWHRMFDDILVGAFINDKTIGQVYMDARNSEYNRCIIRAPHWACGDPWYALIGDPTLKPRHWPHTGGW